MLRKQLITLASLGQDGGFLNLRDMEGGPQTQPCPDRGLPYT